MISLILSAFAVQPPKILPAPVPGPRSGSFQCEMRDRRDKAFKISGELGVAGPSDKLAVRERMLVRSEKHPELNGIYVADYKELVYRLVRIGKPSAYMHFYMGVAPDAVVTVQQYPGPGQGIQIYAGHCSITLRMAEGRVIQ